MARHRDSSQPSGLVQFDKRIPGLGNDAGQVAKIPDQCRGIQFGDKVVDRAVVDGLRRDTAQARPPRETRKAMADTLCGGRKQAGPNLVDLEVGGLEHRQQARGVDGAGKVAAQVGPPLPRYLRGRQHAVESLADLGKIERNVRSPTSSAAAT
jgi:hypothetical protein